MPSPQRESAEAVAASHCLHRLLGKAADGRPSAAAMLAPGRATLAYRELLDRIDSAHESLRALGLGRGDRIATVLPDSSEAALAMIALMSLSAATPINPRNPSGEIARQLSNLRAGAVIVERDAPAPIRAAVERSGLAVIELARDGSGVAGGFELSGRPVAHAGTADREPGAGRDPILVIQTSGTTGKPKIVSLTQDQLLSMMLANCGVLGLSPEDRCLGVMPLFHVHGLGAVLVSLLSGGSVVVAGGFSADAFFEQVAHFRPTWYTAVPTIHQAVLDRAEKCPEIARELARDRPFRIVRSGSAPMPPGLPERLEATFGAIYLEACGATECSACIASNRPHDRKIGSQGPPMPGMDVRVIDEGGRDLPAGQVGELIVRGPGVFDGYEDDPELDAVSFFEGYFRTGDLASRDDDGFITLKGRIKEQINRGGMKVAPADVDEVMRRHPAVEECVTFGMPDAMLGEEVACAIVPRRPEVVAEIDLQRHAAEHLADFRVPRRIVVLDAIPKGPTGKVVRIGLAETLGLSATSPSPAPRAGGIEPRSPAEQRIAASWSNALGMAVLDIDAPFPQLGGDSMQAARMVLDLEEKFGVRVPLAALFAHDTIRKLARLVESDGWRPEAGMPVLLREGSGGGPVLFCLPGAGGNVYGFQAIASRLGEDRRVIGLPLPGADGLEPPLASVEEIATRFLGILRAQQPRGPYLLAGYSFGGKVAVEIARRLHESGEPVRFVGLLDTPGPGWPGPPLLRLRIASKIRRTLAGFRRRLGLGSTPSATDYESDPTLVSARLPEAASAERHLEQARLIDACKAASRRWDPGILPFPITLLRARSQVWPNCDVSDETMGWGKVAGGGLDIVSVPGAHHTLFREPFGSVLAREIQARL